MNETVSPLPTESQLPVFNIEKLYVKDLSLEIPHAPGIFLEREQPQVDLQLHTLASRLDEGVFEVSITVTVTARLAEKGQVMFPYRGQAGGRLSFSQPASGRPGNRVGCRLPQYTFPLSQRGRI